MEFTDAIDIESEVVVVAGAASKVVLILAHTHSADKKTPGDTTRRRSRALTRLHPAFRQVATRPSPRGVLGALFLGAQAASKSVGGMRERKRRDEVER
eukprot:CAMPEP_0198282282 /NCGR_PEP_ID=MMETSP1449-20131203/2132_1 /TAXON_ID=420275 /ORGANISM="Attheya septentrionalis, Strain CCMP2084" /LENGTH=97 /DNA_ID=CAMNT_0043978481 /DNA_START=450 /DNA_END=743 /DNA_ORIENTATION=-